METGAMQISPECDGNTGRHASLGSRVSRRNKGVVSKGAKAIKKGAFLAGGTLMFLNSDDVSCKKGGFGVG
jgi:hypothetical protein